MQNCLPDFTDRLRSALGKPDTSLVLLGNFEVEDQWARNRSGLPRVSPSASKVIVNRMDEFALLLGGPGDIVVLKAPPDTDYLAYLEELGFALPRVLSPGRQDPQRTVTEDALADPRLIDELRRDTGSCTHIWPHGVSTLEERLAEAADLPLAAPKAALCERVNSKIYSRRLADELAVRQPIGWPCEALTDLASVAAPVRDLLDSGRRIAVKDALGVSGRGIVVVTSSRRFDRLCRMLVARERQFDSNRANVVVEEWVAKRTDLNYQITISRAGGVHLDFVKEAITDGGVHKGHRIPARLTGEQAAELADVAHAVGAHLHADGYFGVAGIDAMVDLDGGLYPIVEINARNNMSTYQVRVQEQLISPRDVVLARHYHVRLHRPLPFQRLRSVLGEFQFDHRTRRGFLVNNFAALNAAAPRGVSDSENPTLPPFEGRLYGLVVGRSADEVAALDDQVADRVATLGAGVANGW